jgi:SAM-dependent methyltransferase
MNSSQIKKTLLSIEAISSKNIEVFSTRTRDAAIPVFRDVVSEVIFIDDYYVGDQEYINGVARKESQPLEDLLDTQRRIREHTSAIYGKKILDFGFGPGTFLEAAKATASSVAGVELELQAEEFSARTGIQTFERLSELTHPIDTVFAFHVLEHLPDPLGWLTEIREVLMGNNGSLIIEVPHARDLLLTSVPSEAFRSHTLWSQHLVLHTRESLRKLLLFAGFTVGAIYGVQRYGLGNHLGWMSEGRPGTHFEAPFRSIESRELVSAYESSLVSLDLSDTLVAIASPNKSRSATGLGSP